MGGGLKIVLQCGARWNTGQNLGETASRSRCFQVAAATASADAEVPSRLGVTNHVRGAPLSLDGSSC